MQKLELQKIASSREMILSLLCIVAIFVLFLRMFYLPKSEEIETIKEKISTLSLEEEAMQKFTSAITAQDRRRPVVPSRSLDIKTQILMGKKKTKINDMASLMETITTPKFLQGVVLDSLGHADEKAGTGFVEIPLVFVAHGSFQKITSFLEKMENLVALITMNSLSLTTNPQNPSDVMLELSATLYRVGVIPQMAETPQGTK